MQNKLVFINQQIDTITDSHLYGGVNYECVINSEEDLVVGDVASAKLTFSTDSLNIGNLGATFTYYVIQDNDEDWRRVGIFSITDITKNTYGRYDIEAFDNVVQLDRNINEWAYSDYKWHKWTRQSTSRTNVNVDVTNGITYADSIVFNEGTYTLSGTNFVIPTEWTCDTFRANIAQSKSLSKTSEVMVTTSSNPTYYYDVYSSLKVLANGKLAVDNLWTTVKMDKYSFNISDYAGYYMMDGNNIVKISSTEATKTVSNNQYTWSWRGNLIALSKSTSTSYDGYLFRNAPASGTIIYNVATGTSYNRLATSGNFSSNTLNGKYYVLGEYDGSSLVEVPKATSFNSSYTQTYVISDLNTQGSTTYETVTSQTRDYPIDGWVNNDYYKLVEQPNVEYPITVGDLFSKLCEGCGVVADSSEFTNSTILLSENPFGGDVILARTLISYIAGVAGGYVKALSNGNIAIKHFDTTSSRTLNNSMYKTLWFADYLASSIDKVQVAMDGDDIGVIVGEGVNTLQIPYNPIFYNDDTEVVRDYVTNIYNVVHNYSYTPMVITLREDFGIEAGDVISVNNATTYVFRKKMTKSGVELESTGNYIRKTTTDLVNEDIQALVGKYNRLTRTVDETVNEVGNLKTGLSQTVRIAADGVTITNQDGDTLVINGGCVDATTINTTDLNMTGRIAWDDLSSGAKTTIDNEIAKSATYKQNTMPTNPVEGDCWYVTGDQDITVGGVTYYHHYTYYYNGTSWDTIALPSYIKSTYIDFSQVVSPKIVGQDIDLQGGTFNIKDLTGARQYGYLGFGSGTAGSSTVKNGVIFSYSNDSNLNWGDYYVICAEDGIRICANSYALIVNNNGVYVQQNGGAMTPISVAKFA